MKNNFLCKSITLANFLIKSGSNIIRVDKDNKNESYLVFIFERNDLLDNNLKKWNKNK